MGAAWDFEDHGAIFRGGVGGDVADLGLDSVLFLETAKRFDFNAAKLALGGILFRMNPDMDGLIDRVGEQAFFTRMDGVNQALASECSALEDGEVAIVEGERGIVFEPQGAKRLRLGFAPESYALNGESLLEDGYHCRFVFVDGDRLSERVLEEIVEGVGGYVFFYIGFSGAEDTADDAAASISAHSRSITVAGT